MKVRDWLDLAVAIEKRSAELYGRFASLFESHEEISRYWRRMEEDEIRHEAILAEVIGSLDAADSSNAIREGNAARTTKLLSCITDDLSKMFSNLDEAYECAHALEEKEVEIIFDLLRDDRIGRYEGVHTLLKEDQEHLQKLIDFSENFGRAPWRKLIKP